MKNRVIMVIIFIMSLTLHGCGYISLPNEDENDQVVEKQKIEQKQKKLEQQKLEQQKQKEQKQQIQPIQFGTYTTTAKFHNPHTRFITSDKVGFIFYTPNNVPFGVTTLKFDVVNINTDTIAYTVNKNISPDWKGMQGNLLGSYTTLPVADYQLNVSYLDGKLIAQGKFQVTSY